MSNVNPYKRIPKAEFVAGNTKRKRIMSLCYQLPESLGFVYLNTNEGKHSINMKRLDDWLTVKGPFNKPLNYHTQKELSHVIVQFENMLKGYLKGQTNA